MTIWEYEAEARSGRHTIQTNGSFLKVKTQCNKVVFYFKVDPNKFDFAPQYHDFIFIMTGQSFEDEPRLQYIDTLMFDDDDFVLHIFKHHGFLGA